MTFRVETQDDGSIEVFDDAGGCWGLTAADARRIARLCEECLVHGYGVVEVGNVGESVLRIDKPDLAMMAQDLRAGVARSPR